MTTELELMALCNELNASAETYLRDNEVDPLDADNYDEIIGALEKFAQAVGFQPWKTGDQCEIWAHGRDLINLWIEGGMRDGLQDGGLGFDMNIEWYTKREPSA